MYYAPSQIVTSFGNFEKTASVSRSQSELREEVQKPPFPTMPGLLTILRKLKQKEKEIRLLMLYHFVHIF